MITFTLLAGGITSVPWAHAIGNVFHFKYVAFEQRMVFLFFSFSLKSMTQKWLVPMSISRGYFATCLLNGKIYVAGGYKDNSVTSKVECYDPVSNVWSTRSSLGHARSDFGLVALSGKLYAIGGKKYIERFDPAQNAWTVVCWQTDGGLKCEPDDFIVM